MDPVGLYLVALDIRDAPRRTRIRRVLAGFGQAVNKDTFEVATNQRGVRALQTALAPDLREGDTVRIYPVCKRCRLGVALHGPGELASLPTAYVY